MESLTRGWSFLTQAWKMALADKDLLKPSFYALLVGFVVGLIGLVPMGITIFLFSASDFGQIIISIVGAGLVFVQFCVTYIFSAMTIYLIYGYISEGDGKMEKAWQIVRRDWLDILTLAAASTLVEVVKNLIRGGKKKRNAFREMIADLINTLWTEATYLVLPIMVIEDLNLKDGLQRATYITKNNLLLIGVSTIGINFINGIIGFVFTALGIGLGFGISFPLFHLANNELPYIVAALIPGVLLASVFIMAGSLITSYTATAYHTCLYLWARDVEQNGQNAHVPAPLAAVLGGSYATH